MGSFFSWGNYELGSDMKKYDLERGKYGDLGVGLFKPFYFLTDFVLEGYGGIGLGNENVSLLVGLRPFPLTAYAQFNITLDQRSSIVLSGEKGNGKDQYLSLGSYGNFNVGYRWAMKKKNRKIKRLSE